MVKIRVKAVKVGNSVRIAIPSEILREGKINVGDTLLIDYDAKSDYIVLEKAAKESN